MRYHFQVSDRFIPYLGVHFGWAYARAEADDDSDSSHIFTYGLQGGFKIPIAESVYFDTQVKWTEYESDFDELGFDLDLTTVQVMFGLGFKF